MCNHNRIISICKVFDLIVDCDGSDGPEPGCLRALNARQIGRRY